MSSSHSLLPQIYRVAERRPEIENVVTLCLEPETGGPCLGAPGQFSMLYAFGVGEVPMSISRCPSGNGPVWHTVRAVGPVSTALSRLQAGDAVGWRGPYGNVWPLDAARKKDVLLVAGGLGLAPMRPVVDHILANRESFGRAVLLYGARSPQDIVYGAELETWASCHDLEVEITVDHATGGWNGHVGVVTSLIETMRLDPEAAVSMVCGPGLMMRFTVAALEDAGCEPASIFVSMERNMKCAIAQCGRCQYGPNFICRDGPIFRYDKIKTLFRIADI